MGWFSRLFSSHRSVTQPVKKAVGSIQFEIIKGDLQKLWDTVDLDDNKIAVIKQYSDAVYSNKDQFIEASKLTGVPAMLIGCLQAREADSLKHMMNYHLCNGQPWNMRTTIVPKGVGPFKSWLESALFALKYDGLDNIKSWDMPRILFQAEKFNGFGYRLYHSQDLSPYVWACTNHNDGTGYYKADGSYDSGKASENYPGVAAIMKYLIDTKQMF